MFISIGWNHICAFVFNFVILIRDTNISLHINRLMLVCGSRAKCIFMCHDNQKCLNLKKELTQHKPEHVPEASGHLISHGLEKPCGLVLNGSIRGLAQARAWALMMIYFNDHKCYCK